MAHVSILKDQQLGEFTDRSNVVVLLWFSVACFGVRVLVTFHLMFVRIIFNSD